MKKILFFTPFCYWNVHTAYELLLAKSLQLRGASVLNISCDTDIPFCDIHDDSYPAEHICQMCTNNRQNMFNRFQLNNHPLKKIISRNIKENAFNIVDTIPDSKLLNFHYDNKPLALWIHSSVNTFFRINEIDISIKEINKKFRDYLKSAIIIYDTFKKLLEVKQPDILLMFNGRFFTFRIPLEIAKSLDIKTIVHDRGMYDNTIMFKENEVIQGMNTLRNLWNNRKHFPLSYEQIEKTRNYIHDREFGKNTGWYSWSKDKIEVQNLKRILEIEEYKRIYTFFTSSDDEMAAFREWSGIYSSQNEFIEELISFFKNKLEYKLIIRIHPNTGKTKGNKKENSQFLEYVEAIRSDLSQNITIVKPEDDINSYQLIEMSDLVITYFSTISIESVVRNTPVLLTGGGPYANLEFLNTLENKSDLNEMLDLLPEKHITYNDFKLAYRFFYNYFILSGFELKSIKQKTPIIVETKLETLDDLIPGNDENLDHICNAILKDKSIYDFSYLNDSYDELIEDNELSKSFKTLENINVDEKMSKIIISVIIPTYNRSSILIKALEALNKQTLNSNEFEVIISDDGSTDDTEEIVNNYVSSYNIKYLKQNNKGPGAARNLAIEHSQGELLLIINDDTILAHDNLEKHLEAHQKFTGEKISVLGTFEFMKEAQRKPFIFFTEQTSLIFAYNQMEKHHKYNYRFFWTCNISIKKQAIIDAGMFDEDFSEPMMEDTELGYKLQKIGYEVLFFPEAKAEHYDFSFSPEKFAKRQQMSARNIVKFVKKHPETLKSEGELFGFNKLNEKTLISFRHIKEQTEKVYHKQLKLLNEINKIEIINPNFIPITKDRHIKADDLLKIMMKSVLIIHQHNYSIGIIEAMENFGNADIQNESESVIFNNRFNNKPKILFTMFGWNDFGGGTMFPKAAAEEIANRGYQIGVFYSGGKHKDNSTPYYLHKQLENNVILYGLYNRHSDFWLVDRPDLEIKDEDVINKFKDVLDEFQPDIVHYYNFLGLSFAISDEVKSRGIKSVYSPENYHLIDPMLYMMKTNYQIWHNTDIFDNSILPEKYPDMKSFYERRNERALKTLNYNIDLTLNISNRVKEYMIDFGAEPDKMRVVHQIPTVTKKLSETKIKETPPYPIKFGFLGTVMPHKGTHILLEAAKRLPKDKYKLIIYGLAEREYLNQIKANYSNLNISLKGKYEPSQLPEIVNSVDVMVIPSIWEECAGLVVLESIALKTPVIISRIGGMPDFVQEGINGYTYSHSSPNNLYAIMKHLIDNPNEIQRLSENCKMPVQFNDYVSYILMIYDKVLKNQNKEIKDFLYKNYLD
jgi:glycosyltransferase involved in cell wall biosynthesis/GT2 family glycosyltransferase